MSMPTNEKLNLIFGRRSIRVYSPGEVSDSVVTQLLQGAMAAPSAMTKDPWRFIVVRQSEMLAKLGAALPGGKMLPTATLAIAVCGDLDAAFDRNLGYLLQDCSAAIQNLLLCAHGLGLGACWVGVHPSPESTLKVRELLSVPSSIVPVAIIALGQPGEELPPRTRFDPAFVHAEKW